MNSITEVTSGDEDVDSVGAAPGGRNPHCEREGKHHREVGFTGWLRARRVLEAGEAAVQVVTAGSALAAGRCQITSVGSTRRGRGRYAGTGKRVVTRTWLMSLA
jgi:hypothetical protein